MYDRNDPYADIASSSANKGSVKAPGAKNKEEFLAAYKVQKMSFLLTIREMMMDDICLSQQLTGLFRQFDALESSAEGKCDVPDLICNGCTGINEANFSDNLGDCFAITEFHMQMQQGKNLLLLAKLRSELQKFVLEETQLLGDPKLCKEFAGKMNQIINTLSQMICLKMGGSECQRA